MKALCFCSQVLEAAPQPGSVVRTVRLQMVPVKDSVDNSKLFGSAPQILNIELTGLLPELIAQFGGGRQVSVELTVLPANPL